VTRAMLVRHATVDDMAAIKALVDWGASTGELVPCHAKELAERLDQFWVVADSDQILGVCALRPVAKNLAELCSLAVWPERQRHGLGRRLVRTCLDWARQRRMHAVFALTFHPAYFEQLGFYRVEAQQAPPDVWEAYAQPAKTLVGNERVLRYDLRRVSENL
jgi:amino-acid N-acetyltransferase